MRTHIEGIPLGRRRGPIAPVIKALKEHGFTTERFGTVSELRYEVSSGVLIANSIHCSSRFSANDASKKDDLYLKVAKAGVLLRENQKGSRKHCLSSHHFTENIAKHMVSADYRVDANLVHNAIRAMRMELVLESGNVDSNLKKSFLDLATKFVVDFKFKDDHETPQQYPLNLAVILDNKWLRTIPDFYNILHSQPGRTTIGSWTPYEVDFLQEFYQDRIISRRGLSHFDQLVLKSYLDGEFTTCLAERVRKETGLIIYQKDLALHRNALVYGRFVNPDFQRGKRYNES